MNDSSSVDRVALTYELALKTARMMGADDFIWKKEYLFDHGELAVMEWLTDVTPEFIPAGMKPSLWNEGLIWAQPKNREQFFFPALQTIYDDDTSVLNSWLTIQGIVTVVKIADDAWREHTGTSSMADNVFTDTVLAYVNRRLAGIFDGLLVVIPEVNITAMDELRGYSWELINKIYSANMKTKMVNRIESYRLSDLANGGA